MSFLSTFLKWIRKGKITAWKATDSDLDGEASPTQSGFRGSYDDSKPDGREFKGVKITIPVK